MSSKKGEMSIALIVSIVIAVAILVLIIVGISSGWSAFTKNTQQDHSNIDVVVRACELACTSGQTYNYCSQKRELIDGSGNKGSFTCSEIVKGVYANSSTKELYSVTDRANNVTDGANNVTDGANNVTDGVKVTVGLSVCSSISC